MTTCLAIRHVAFEDLGTLGTVLDERGVAVRMIEAGADDIAALDPLAPDLVVVLGGPIGATEDYLYPFLADEARLLTARLAAGRPVLGFCLGAQLMARALGARVVANPAGKEIGWSELTLTEAGRASALAGLAGLPVLHWHGDTFELPDGATLLASTAITPNQAFSWGPAALALQFHPEVGARGLERWLIGHAGELASGGGGGAVALRQANWLHAPGLGAAAGILFRIWLDANLPPAEAAVQRRRSVV